MQQEQAGKRRGSAGWASAWGAVAVGVAVLAGRVDASHAGAQLLVALSS